MKSRGYYVGQFSEIELDNGTYRAAVEKAMAETGFQCINTEIVYRNGIPYALKAWVCDMDAMRF